MLILPLLVHHTTTKCQVSRVHDYQNGATLNCCHQRNSDSPIILCVHKDALIKNIIVHGMTFPQYHVKIDMQTTTKGKEEYKAEKQQKKKKVTFYRLLQRRYLYVGYCQPHYVLCSQ